MIALSDITVITPCSRPQNLPLLHKSIGIGPRWIIVADADRVPEFEAENTLVFAHHDQEGVGGNAQRNFALDLVQTPYVYFLDDDNLVHPKFLQDVPRVLEPGEVAVVDQRFKNGAIRLRAAPENMRPCHIDTAQFLTPMGLVGDARWRKDRCCQDGVFFSTLWKQHKTRFRFIPHALCYYNYLRS